MRMEKELQNLVKGMVEEGDDILATVKESIIIAMNRINVAAQRDRDKEIDGADMGALDAQADRSEG